MSADIEMLLFTDTITHSQLVSCIDELPNLNKPYSVKLQELFDGGLGLPNALIAQPSLIPIQQLITPQLPRPPSQD